MSELTSQRETLESDPRRTNGGTVGYGTLLAPQELEGSGRVLHTVLARRAARDPDAVLVTFLDDRSYTAGEVHRGAEQAAGALQGAGVERGDRVALFLDNRVEMLTTWFGVSAAGGVSVPLNTAMRGDVLRYQLEQTSPVILFIEGQYLAQVAPVLAEAQSIRTVVVLDGDELPRSGVGYEDFLAGAPRPTAVEAEPWDLAAIFYTSGTTGPSKGVMWSHNVGVHMAESAQWVMGYSPDDVLFTALPLFHANALFVSFFPCLIFDSRIVIAPRFSVSQFWEQVARAEATTVNLLGSMGPLLLRQPPTPLERAHKLRLGLVIPTPADIDEFERRFNLPVTELYGLTDSNLPLGVPYGQRRPGSCGLPVPGWECQIVDDNDEPVGRGEYGELIVRPTRPFIGQLGYWKMTEATLEAWRNLWFHTGDLMRQDQDGWYYFGDRKKDALRRSGENVSSFEVEQVLLCHPAVKEVAVYAARSEFAEDEVMAALVLEPGHEVTPQDLIDFCEPRLAYFAVPRYIDIRSALPKTQTEKIQKNVLRKEGITPSTWDRGPSGRRFRERSS